MVVACERLRCTIRRSQVRSVTDVSGLDTDFIGERGGTRTLDPMIKRGANLGRLFTDYQTLVEICRPRADELALSRLEIDRLGGLPSG